MLCCSFVFFVVIIGVEDGICKMEKRTNKSKYSIKKADDE